MINNDFCIDITDRVLDNAGIHSRLQNLISDYNLDDLYKEDSDAIDLVLSPKFIDLMDYMEKMEYIPALILMRANLTVEMYKFVSWLCKFDFFANMRYFASNSSNSLDRANKLLSEESFIIYPDDKIYKLQNISILDNLNQMAEQAKLDIISYSDACYYSVISYSISCN